MWFLGLVLCLGTATAQLIPGYPRGSLVFGGRMKLGWDFVNSTHVRFAFETEGWQWAGLGFQKGTSKMTGDAVVVQAGSIDAYDCVFQNVPTLKTQPYFSNATATLIGNTLRGEFTRSIAAPHAGDVALTLTAAKLFLGVAEGAFPSTHSARESVQIDLTLTDAPTLVPVTIAPTASSAPTSALATSLNGYTHKMTALGGKVKFGWNFVDNANVKFGFEATGVQWVSLGFQDPTSSTKMTGDAVVIETPFKIDAYNVVIGQIPLAKTATYFSSASGAKTGNLLHGEFTRSLAAPQATDVPINTSSVRLMLAYSYDFFPNVHTERVEVTVDLKVSGSQDVSAAFTNVFTSFCALALVCGLWL